MRCIHWLTFKCCGERKKERRVLKIFASYIKTLFQTPPPLTAKADLLIKDRSALFIAPAT
jgi:hypothetical protein